MIKKFTKKIPSQDIYLITITLIAIVAMGIIPSGFSETQKNVTSIRTRATVLSVDNSLIKEIGPVIEGTQQVTIRIETGQFQGEDLDTINVLIGKKELDKVFKTGDSALVVLDLTTSKDTIIFANMIDHYRTDKSIFLILFFFTSLLLVAGWIGFKAIISFIFTAMIILKVLLPAFLKGINPIFIAFLVVTILTAVIIFLVGGLSRKGLSAFLGSFAGLLTTVLLAVGFSSWFHLSGATSPFLEALLYSGFGHINLTNIFIAGIFVASSGAVMDLAMDISASMHEVYEKHPNITRLELMVSGLTVGRHAVGTMTTTLLLAYSGGYTGMLMTFIGRGVPFENVLNMAYVSSELVHTFVGSFGLVLVAPFTALAGSMVFIPPRTKRIKKRLLIEE